MTLHSDYMRPPTTLVKILYKTGATEEYAVESAEFGNHPSYFEVVFNKAKRHIPTIEIAGIAFEKIVFM